MQLSRDSVGFKEAHASIYNGRRLYTAVACASAAIAVANLFAMSFKTPLSKVVQWDSFFVSVLSFSETSAALLTPLISKLIDFGGFCHSIIDSLCRNPISSIGSFILKSCVLGLCALAGLAFLANSLSAGTPKALVYAMLGLNIFVSYCRLSKFARNVRVQFIQLHSFCEFTRCFSSAVAQRYVRKQRNLANMGLVKLANSLYHENRLLDIKNMLTDKNPCILTARNWRDHLQAYQLLADDVSHHKDSSAYRMTMLTKLVLQLPILLTSFAVASSQMGSVQQAIRHYLSDDFIKLSPANSERIEGLAVLPIWAMHYNGLSLALANWLDVIALNYLIVRDSSCTLYSKLRRVFNLPAILSIAAGSLSYSIAYYAATHGTDRIDEDCDSYLFCPGVLVVTAFASIIPSVSAVQAAIRNSSTVLNIIRDVISFVRMGGRMRPVTDHDSYSDRTCLSLNDTSTSFRQALSKLTITTSSSYLDKSANDRDLPKVVRQAMLLSRGYLSGDHAASQAQIVP